MRRHKNARIGIIGDFCVDIYWHADMTKSELTRDSALSPADSRREGSISVRAEMLRRISRRSPQKSLFRYPLSAATGAAYSWKIYSKKSGMDRDFVIKVPDRFTNAYCKPMRKGHIGA